MNFRNVIRQPKHGLTGVRHDGKRKIYQCYIVDKDKKRYQKCFADFFEACCWRKSMEHQFGYVALNDQQKYELKKQKKTIKNMKYYEKHREKLLAKQKDYYQKNKVAV